MNYSNLYLKELSSFDPKYFSFLKGKSICLSGSTGLIGSFLIDVLLYHNVDVTIYALVRDVEKDKKRFSYFSNKNIHFVKYDISKEIEIKEKVDYLIHMASLTDPYSYSNFPVETMNINFLGTKNMLDLAKKNNAKFMFISSCEVYGKNEAEKINEDDYGYLNILDPRSCYNESKKASETLCVCYHKEYGVNVIIPRLTRIYGPTMKLSDTKALSQFINKGLNKEDIVLKSAGTQKFNYSYVGDVVISLFILLKENNKEIAYNIANEELFSLREIAEFIAKKSGTKVIFDIPSKQEQQGYSKSLVSSLNPKRFIDEYNYELETDIFQGLVKTLDILENK